jgi:hypothetical protein
MMAPIRRITRTNDYCTGMIFIIKNRIKKEVRTVRVDKIKNILSNNS